MSKVRSISIILPALYNDTRYTRCIHSIDAAFEGKSCLYEVVVVTPYPDAFVSQLPSVKVLKESGRGIYAAMNNGIAASKYDYIYFVGQDDIVLPSFYDALVHSEEHFDLLIADVFFGKNKIYKNRSSKYNLVVKNWCHQGLIYNKKSFIKYVGGYNLEYKSQADHYANIIMLSEDINIFRFDGCVSWYSADGFSTIYKDNKFRMDFPKIVYNRFGLFCFLLVILRRAAAESYGFIKGIIRG